jgi:hypothetical protein
VFQIGQSGVRGFRLSQASKLARVVQPLLHVSTPSAYMVRTALPTRTPYPKRGLHCVFPAEIIGCKEGVFLTLFRVVLGHPVLQKKRALRDSVICLNLNAYASLPSQVSIHRGLQPLHVSSLNAVSTCVSSLKLLSQRVVLRRESGGVYLARGPSRPSRVEVYRYRTD